MRQLLPSSSSGRAEDVFSSRVACNYVKICLNNYQKNMLSRVLPGEGKLLIGSKY